MRVGFCLSVLRRMREKGRSFQQTGRDLCSCWNRHILLMVPEPLTVSTIFSALPL